VLGTTTPLYTALLALAGLFFGGSQAPFPVIAVALNSVFDAITVALLLRLGNRLGFPRAGVAAALTWAIQPFSVTFAIGGMETSLFICLLTATVWAYLEEHEGMAALLASLSLLTRPDAVLLVGALALDWLIRIVRAPGRRSSPWWRVPVAFSLPLIAWTLFAWGYYGTPIPHSVAAKEVAYLMPPKAALIRLIQHYATPFLGHETFGIPWIGVGLILYPFLFVIGARSALQRSRQLWAWVLYPWLYFAAFALANPLIFRWYLAPPLTPYLFFIWIGLDTLLNASPRLQRTYTALIMVIPLLLLVRGWELHPDHGPDRPAPRMAWFQLEILYQQAAETLTSYLQPGDTLAAADIGTLGYYTNARILDTLGLVSPQAMPYYPLSPDQLAPDMVYAVPTELILDNTPDYLVFLEAYIRNTLLQDSRFQESYRLIQTIPTNIYGSKGMMIFARR